MPSHISAFKNRKTLITAGIVFIVYLAAAQLGYKLYTAPTVLTPIAGLNLAVLFLYGLGFAPVIFFSALISYLLNGAATGTLIVLPLAQMIQAMFGAYLLKRLRFNLLLGQLRDVLILIAVSVVTSIILPTFGIFSKYLNAEYFNRISVSPTWGTWWIGTIISSLVIFPFIARWAGKPKPDPRTKSQYVEAAIALVLIVIIDYFLFWTNRVRILDVSLVYILLVPFFWIAIRIGPRLMTLALLITTAIGIAGTFFYAAPPGAALSERLYQAEIFFIIFSIIFFIVVAVEEERKDTLLTLNNHTQKLEDALDNLHSQDQVRREFLAMLAHELRNPIAPLMSSVETLRLQRSVNEQNGEILDIMDNELRHLRRLLDDLLDAARLSQKKLTLQKAPVAINSIINDSIESTRSMIQSRGQHLIVTMPQETIPVEADEIRLEQACINLLNNASKFSKSEGTIELVVRKDNDRVTVSVRDQGIGIEPEFLDDIFEPFHQGKLTDRNDGIGIGLALAKNVIEMHGGTLSAKSEGKNRGSEFTLSLPILKMPEDALVKKPPAVVTAPSDQAKYRILVVDDNIAAAQGMARLLTLKGYLSEMANSGKEAQEKNELFKPHAIVLDIGLPDIDGYSLARFFREGNIFSGPLIALSGYGQEEDKRKAKEAGFDYHLTKPIGIAELIAVLIESL